MVEQQKSHAVPDAPIHPGSSSTEVTGAYCERNLCVMWVISWTCWIPESTLNRPAADRAGVITSSSLNLFTAVNVTRFPLAYAERHRAKESCSMVCPRAREHFFPHKKSFAEGKNVIRTPEGTHWAHRAFQSEKAYIDIHFPLIHFISAQNCLVQTLWQLSNISTYKEGGEAHRLFSLREGLGWVGEEGKGPIRVKCTTAYCRLERPYSIYSACAE